MFKMRQAQAWGIDLMIASIIFTFGIVLFYFYSINEPMESKENIGNLFYDGEILAKTLFSDGYPKDWNLGDAVKIGILSDNKINETKLERFYNFVDADYNKTKTLFNTRYDYYFFLDQNITINSIEIEGIGKLGANKTNINSENLIKITRFTIYKEKPVTAYIYVWEE